MNSAPNGVPYGAGNFSPVEATQRLLAYLGRLGATRILRTPALPASVPAATGPTAPSISQAITIYWRESGTVLAMYGQERTGTVAKFATTEARIQYSGSEDFVTDGNLGTYMPFLALFGPNVNWFPIMRPVSTGVQWTITYRNTDTGAVANPDLMFAFVSDADLARFKRGS